MPVATLRILITGGNFMLEGSKSFDSDRVAFSSLKETFLNKDILKLQLQSLESVQWEVYLESDEKVFLWRADLDYHEALGLYNLIKETYSKYLNSIGNGIREYVKQLLNNLSLGIKEKSSLILSHLGTDFNSFSPIHVYSLLESGNIEVETVALHRLDIESLGTQFNQREDVKNFIIFGKYQGVWNIYGKIDFSSLDEAVKEGGLINKLDAAIELGGVIRYTGQSEN
jgi:hypothetical protein